MDTSKNSLQGATENKPGAPASSAGDGADPGPGPGVQAQPTDKELPRHEKTATNPLGGGRPRGSKTKRLNLRKPLPMPELFREPAGAEPIPTDGQPAGNFPTVIWTAENCKNYAAFPFIAAATLDKCDAWLLTNAEAEAISKPLADTLNMYFPEAAKYSPIGALVVTLAVVFKSKSMDVKKIKDQEAKEADKK